VTRSGRHRDGIHRPGTPLAAFVHDAPLDAATPDATLLASNPDATLAASAPDVTPAAVALTEAQDARCPT